jgi:hypothetical protein
MDAAMISKFMPIILDYIGGTGGESVKKLLAGVLQ